MTMLIFKRSYDDFMIFIYDKFMITNWSPLIINKKDHLTAQCRQKKQIENI